jgi:hypothetical protein
MDGHPANLAHTDRGVRRIETQIDIRESPPGTRKATAVRRTARIFIFSTSLSIPQSTLSNCRHQEGRAAEGKNLPRRPAPTFTSSRSSS